MNDSSPLPKEPTPSAAGHFVEGTVGSSLDPGSPWKAIWNRPQAVMRWVLDTNPSRHVATLLLLGAIASALNDADASATTLGTLAYGLAGTLALWVPIIFLTEYFVAPPVLVVVGRWFGGTGDRVALRAAIAYGSIPMIWTIPISLIASVLRAARIMLGELADPARPVATPLFFALMGLAIVAGIIAVWGVVALVNCVAAAHRYGGWRSIFTLLLSLALALAVIDLIEFLVNFLMR